MKNLILLIAILTLSATSMAERSALFIGSDNMAQVLNNGRLAAMFSASMDYTLDEGVDCEGNYDYVFVELGADQDADIATLNNLACGELVLYIPFPSMSGVITEYERVKEAFPSAKIMDYSGIIAASANPQALYITEYELSPMGKMVLGLTTFVMTTGRDPVYAYVGCDLGPCREGIYPAEYYDLTAEEIADAKNLVRYYMLEVPTFRTGSAGYIMLLIMGLMLIVRRVR